MSVGGAHMTSNGMGAILTVVLVSSMAVFGQDDTSGQGMADRAVAETNDKLSGLEESYLETKATVDKLKKFKLSGHIQAQVRYAIDTAGNANYRIGDYAGGAFAENTKGVVQVRRGRFKLAYDNTITQAVIQLDCIPKGVSIKDAYLQFTDPWIKTVSVKGGVFDRPFGFEISYSSSSRESPERSRLFQTLFPGERDLGFQLGLQAPENLPPAAQAFNFKGGWFAGNGISDETDRNLDFIGRLGFAIPITSANMSIDGGISGYYGKVTCTDTTVSSRTVAKVDTSKWTVKTTYAYDSTLGYTVPRDSAVRVRDTTWTVTGRGYSYEIDKELKRFKKSPGDDLNRDFVRQYIGGDLQFTYDIPCLGGLQLRGEVIGGAQPGTKGSSGFYNTGRGSNQPVYDRNFLGWYAMWVQNWGSRIQSVLKYDSYDPNMDIAGKDIDSAGVKSGGLSTADLRYNTLGAGLVYHWDENLKFVLYYDHVMNETMSDDVLKLKDKNAFYTKDLKDDVITFRIQYKF